MDQPKRKHRSTGNPKGGKREGAGRPEGVENTLAYGEVRAIKATRLRLPKDAGADEEKIAGRCLQRIADVMEGRVHYTEAAPILKAATYLREEVCGPRATKVEHSGANGGPLEVSFVLNLQPRPKDGGQ